MRLWIKCLLLCLMVFGFGCSEDKLSEDLEPELTRVMKGIRFEYPQTYIPRGLNAEFKVYAIYNDLTEEELSNSDLIGNYTWSIETTDTITLSNLATTPRVVSFIGIGDVELTLDYQRDGETFSFNQTFEISTPVIASIAVEEILGSSELIDGLCCSQIADTESSMVKGCVRRFKAIATYDNGDEEDQTSDLLTWESTTNFAEPVEIANLDGYEQINSCISSISESTKGVFFAKETGYFAVSASYSGITGTSSSIEVIEPTVLSIEFDSNNPTEVIEDSKARFSVIGTLNNDTTADIDDIAWSTSNSEKGVFLSSNANGTLTTLDDDDLVDDPIIITATHFTVGSINSPVTIREKVLTFVSIEHKDEEVDLIWNEKKQFQLRAFYNNENNYLLTSGVNWTVDRPEFAEIDSEGILTAGKVTASSEWLRVTGSYQDASDDMLIKVSNSSGELINFYTTPNDLKLIENYFTPVSIVGYFSNQTQQILPSDQFIITNKSGNFDVTRDGDNFLITAHPVDTNQSVSYSAEFQLEGTNQTTQLTISDVYDVQVDSLEIIKDADLVLENTQVQLSIVPTFIGDETNSPSVNKDTVSWSCSPSCSVENGIFTAPAFDATSDATSDTFTITALVTNSDFSNQIKDISADTTIKVQKTPTVYFEKAAEITNESDITIEVTIKSSTTALKDIVVPFFIVDASSDASLTKDYRVLSSPYQVIINEGSDSAVLDIEIMDDNDVESDESIFLMIGPSVVNAAIGSQNTYDLEITANDDAKVSFATGSQRKREDSGVVSIKIEQDVIHYEDVIIGYEVDDFPDCQIPNVRTAKKDYDYLTSTLTGTATIPSGSLSTTIQFHISDDSFHETDECLALRLTNVEPQRVDLGTIVSHVVTIEDDDNLVITSQHNPDNREINNTGTYTYTANITPFDGTSDNWKFNVYNEPVGSVVLTDDVNQSLSLSWETDKHDVGLLDNKIIICISDIDTSGDYSLAPGAQTMCQPFNIEVLTCRLNGAFGDINTASDFLGLYCGGPDNHITVSNGKSLNMGVGQDFGGIVIIESGGKFHVTDGTIDSSADVILSGKLESTGTSLINGLLDTSGDATIGINSNGSLTYNHSSLLLDGVQLTLDLQGNGARLINENPIDLNSDNSRLLIQSSGLGNSVKHIKVTSAQGGSSEYIQVTGDVSVDALTFQADSFLKIESGETLAITGDTDLSGDVALTVDSGGNLVFNSEFNHDSNRPITIQENSTLIPRFNFTLSGDLHLYGGGKLDLSTTNLFLDHNLETSGGILITTIDQTILNLRKPASINANQRLMLNQLLLGDHKLTLGSETSGMDVNLDVVINGSDAGIDAVNGQDLNFYGSLTLSGGSHLDSSGDGSVKISGDLGIDNSSFLSDGTADIGGMITMSEGDFSVNNGNAYLNGGNITSGNFNVSDSVVYLKNDLAINTENLIQTDLTQWYLQPESSLSLGGSSLLIFGGSLQIATGAGLVIDNSSNPFLTGPVTVSQGNITLSDNATFTNSITIDGSADILIPQNKDLTYQHADPIIIGSENLRIYGGGILDNASGGAVLFGSGSGTLILGDGSSGLTELRRLDVSAIMIPPARIELKSDFLITDIETSSDIDIQTNGSDLTLKNLRIWEDLSISGFDPADFYVETIDLNNKTLSFGDNLNVNSGNLFLNGAGRLDGKSLNVNANSEITFVDITADGIDFEIDESTLFFSGRNSFVNGAFSVNNSSIHVDGELLLTPASSSNMHAVWDISADSILSWNGIGTMAGSIILGADSNLSLHNNRSSISAQISLNGNAGIHIGSGGLEYSGGPITLTHQLSLFGGDFDNSSDHKIIVGDNGSILLNQSSGTIDFVNLNSSQHSSNHIVVNADYEVLDLSLNNDSNIYIGSGNTLTVSNILDIPTGIKLTITGGGRLILNGGLNLGDGSQLKAEGSSILQIEGEVNIGNGAQIDLSGGALDLKDKSVHLKSNWTINTDSLTTNLGTDISTDTHELIWEARPGQEFNGTISIGDSQPGNSGRFTVIGQPAEISANIYLYGGTLDIDVTTLVTGNIIHQASSAIDVSGDAQLTYQGEPLEVKALTLTLKGHGDIANTSPVQLNASPSILKISNNEGTLSKLDILFSGSNSEIRVNSNSNFTLSTLTTAESFAIDTSSDSTIRISEPFEVPENKQVSAAGEGNIIFPHVTIKTGAVYDHQDTVVTTWNGMFLSGMFNGETSTFTLTGDVTGDGTFNVRNSQIDISGDVDVLLTGMNSLQSDNNTTWNISKGDLTWNGLGGDLNGAVDVSTDLALRLIENQATIGANLALQGTLFLDVTADVSGDIQLGIAPGIVFQNNTGLDIEKPLTIQSGTDLSVSGIGELKCQDLNVSADATVDISETDVVLEKSPIIDGSLLLSSSNIFVRETANEISGTGQLILQNGAMVLQRNFKVSDFKVSADKNMEWRIEDNHTLTWDTADELAADKILIGDNGGLALLNGSGDVSADIIFMNAQLDFLDSTILKGDINFDDPADPDATVDIIVASDKTLTYKGSSFNLSRKNVVLSGGGNISNDELQTNWFLLNNNGSHLTFASDNGRLTNVKVDSVSSNSEISVEKNFTINHLLLEKELTIYIADGQVLTIDTTLDVGEGATLDVRGSGTLNVKNNFVVQGNVLVSGGILQVENPVNVSSTGNIKLTGGGFKQANGDSLQIKGDGTLDLTSQSLDLNGDLKVFTSIESDATTDIKTNGYILEWHPIEGNTLRGKILIGNDGVFKIIDTKADISADIYLDGGILDIDVTTDVTGSIYHLASSTIDIDSGYSLNYFGNDISVDALTLSLAGNGTMANEQTIVLNDSSSKLKLASGGRLHKATAKADSYIFVPFGADYSISSLIINQPLTVDISTDAALSIEQSLEVPSDTSFVAKGEGALHLNALTVDGTGDIGESIDLKIKNNVEVGSTGYLLADKSSLLFYSSGDSMISGSGNVDLQESRISLDSGSNLDLTLDAPASLSSDTNTRWSVYKNTFTWNGYGGVLKGTIDVSADSVDYGVFHLKDNPATVDAVLNLEGQLKVDVSADMLGSIQIKSDRSSIDLSTDTELLIRQRLTIPDGRELSIQGMGVTELFETLKVEGSGLLKANNTHVRLHNTPDISSDIELRGSTLFFAGNADILAGEGELNLYMSDIVLERNVDINDFDISADGNNDWLIGNGATLTWNSTQELTGNQVDIGIGSELILTKNPVIVSSGIIFKGGKLSSDASSDIIGSISLHDLGEIDVGTGASITYSGEIISLAGKRLTLSGQGDFKNNNATTNWIQLDTAGSQLILNGSGGRVSNVKANNSDTNKLIRAENDFTIEQLVVESNLDIYIEPFKTLTIDATLDIQPGADLTLSGGGTLNVKKAFDVEGSVNIGTNTVLLQQGVTIENTGEVNVNNGKITQPDGQTINIEGNGKLDLTSQSLDLNGDLKVFTSIESDATTDIKTNGYILEWYPVEGNTLHGEIFVGSDGVFKIIDTKADISADIYLDGGMLDIDVTTDVTGSIYHRASSTIDIDSGYSLNYFGNDISVDALTLSLAGNGTMANDQPVVLDENSGKLRFLADGSMKKTRIEATTDSRIEVGGEYFVEQLIVNQPLTIDISPDSMLSIAQPLTIDSTASLDVIGDGSIKLNSINLDSAFNMTAGQVIILSGNLDASSDGILTAKNVSVILNSASDVHFTGDGAMDFTGSTIQMNNNLYLNLDSAGDLTSDSTHWRNNGKILSWNGNGGSLQGQIDLSSDATLLIHETPSIIGANINLYEGHIDIDTTTDVLGTLTSSTEFDASMDVQLGTTLNLNQDLNIDSKNFALSGAGRVIANNLVVDGSTNVNQTSLELYHNLTVNKSLIINDGSLSLDGSADSISGLGPVTIGLNNLNVDFRNDVSVSVDISSDGSTNWDLHGNTLRWNVDSDLNGTGIVLGSQGTLSINRAINISSPMDISSGILDINQDVTLFGSLVPLVSDTTIDVSHDAYLDYSGDELKIGANTLNLNNSGVIENVNDFDLNGSDSVLHLTGQDGMLGKAKFTADSLPDHGIIVDDDYVIQQLTLDGALGRVKVAAGKTLIIGDQLIAQIGTNKLIKDPSNDGTIILHEVVLEGHLEIGEGFTLAPDATLYVKQNATLTVNSDLYFNDGIIVDNGAVLTITGGDHTVTFAGGYNLSGSGQVDVSGDVNVEIESSQVDLSELSRTGKPGTGTINPSKNGALDVLSFSAASKNQEVDLKWVFQDDTYKYVRIIRSANGYPDATSDPTLVYDGTSDNYTDGVQNGISFYYTAFAHDGSGDYAPGVHAMASATIIPDGLIGYYMLGAEDCTNDLLLDSCGLGSHGLCQGSLNPVQDATGDPTGALEFNGLESSAEIDNPYLEVSSIDSDTAADDFTISFWIRTSQTGGDPSADWFDNSNFPIIDGKIGVDQNDFGIALANNRIVFGIGFGNSTFNIASKTIDADWHHIGVTRDYNTGLMQLYLDGKLDATGDGPIHADLNSPSFLGIGRSPFGNTYFEGRLDDIRFYNRVLIESEIESLYENTP